MVVINKMDQWRADHDTVLSYYSSGEGRKSLNKLVKKLCRSGVSPTFHPIACTYNNFKGQAPSGEMSAEASVLTLALLRAEIMKRLYEVQ